MQVTNQLQYLSQVDYIVYLEGGKIAEQGTFADLVHSSGGFSKLIRKHGVEEKDKDKAKKDKVCVRNLLCWCCFRVFCFLFLRAVFRVNRLIVADSREGGRWQEEGGEGGPRGEADRGRGALRGTGRLERVLVLLQRRK